MILTAGCAKYRYNKLDLGDIGGIPRVIDAGQCNDSYSLVVIAQALAKAFGVGDINDLPVAYNIACVITSYSIHYTKLYERITRMLVGYCILEVPARSAHV